MKAKTLFYNAGIVTMDPERRRIKNGAVVVKGDKIEAVGRTNDLSKSYSGDSVI